MRTRSTYTNGASARRRGRIIFWFVFGAVFTALVVFKLYLLIKLF